MIFQINRKPTQAVTAIYLTKQITIQNYVDKKEHINKEKIHEKDEI